MANTRPQGDSFFLGIDEARLGIRSGLRWDAGGGLLSHPHEGSAIGLDAASSERPPPTHTTRSDAYRQRERLELLGASGGL